MRETLRALAAVFYREGKIRATNVTFIFWDLFYPLLYLLVFGVGIDHTLGFTAPAAVDLDYNAFFLAGVLGMASFGIASNTSWSFFMDRDNGIFYEMLTYPLSRAQYLLGKVLFNVLIAVAQAAVTIALAAWLLAVPVRVDLMPLLTVAVVVGTGGWFFFYAIFALRIRRNDIFNTVTSIFYFVFLFASSMFYPLDPLPAWFKLAGYANPITWHVDVLRFLTVGVGSASVVLIEAVAFVLFTVVGFRLAIRSLEEA
jgi:ABC-2 type transport system permease protein